MPLNKIVTGQRISETMYETARRLKRDMTQEEKLLWQNLRGGRLSGLRFRRQQIIGRYVVDFYCHAASVVIELDGGIHVGQKARDRERENHLKALGLRLVRFKNGQVNTNLQRVLKKIEQVCTSQTSPQPSPKGEGDGAA